MLNLIRYSSSSNRRRNCSNLIRVFEYSSRTLTTEPPKDSLYSRLVPIRNPTASLIPILDGWVSEERQIDQQDLQNIIRRLRKFNRYKHALEISEWMTNSKYLDQSPKYHPVQLDLISKVRGLEKAEAYFNKIPETSRDFRLYGAMLNCYADANSLTKTEMIMQKMKELCSDTTLAYNVMLKLYSQMKRFDKLDSLVEEMEDKGIHYDQITLDIRLNAYSAQSNIPGMENLLMKMEGDPIITMNSRIYALVAKGYLKAGAKEKALEMLKKSEQLVRRGSGRVAYEALISLYASLGDKYNVDRLWNLYKKSEKFYNLTYLCMIRALEKLDDLDGAAKILEEWESKKRFFDFRIPNSLIVAYCKKGILEKAELIVKRLEESGIKPNVNTWSHLARGYWANNMMEEMVETMKKVILSSQIGWKPNLVILYSCFRYLNEKGEVEKLEEIKRLLEEKGHNCADICDKLFMDSEKSQNLDQVEANDDDDDDGFDRSLEVEMPESMKY